MVERAARHRAVFRQPFYVGYNVGGYELALDPDGDPASGQITYWGVRNCAEAHSWLLDGGAEERGGVADVGDSIRTATVLGPGDNIIGIIENPHFKLAE